MMKNDNKLISKDSKESLTILKVFILENFHQSLTLKTFSIYCLDKKNKINSNLMINRNDINHHLFILFTAKFSIDISNFYRKLLGTLNDVLSLSA